MKLREKSEIDTQKVLDREREVREGAKLARTVDDLRQLAATEQANLVKFRDESLYAVHGQIQEEIARRDLIRAENARLLAERTATDKPFMEKWLELPHAESVIRKREEAVKQAEIALQLDRDRFEAEQVEQSVEASRLEDLKVRSRKEIIAAHILKTAGVNELANARNEAQTILMQAELRNSHSEHREREVIARERDMAHKERFVAEKAKELYERERAINDKYETLQRSIKRLS